jgi:hypothetical protein
MFNRVVALSDAIARRKRVLLRGSKRCFSMVFLCKYEKLVNCRERAREVA